MATADAIAKALGARRVGSSWMARCPAHEDRAPSLSIRAGNGDQALVYCHAGCDQARVVATLRSLGVWDGRPSSIDQLESNWPGASSLEKKHADHDRPSRLRAASRIWRSSESLIGSPAEIYLRSRGLQALGKQCGLRFHPRLRHPSGGHWPALIGIVLRGHDGKPLGVHRTFLADDGIGKAPVEPQKMMLGPCRGGAVRLEWADKTVMVGEGLESCLSAMQATGLPAWAALSTSGLRALSLPNELRRVIVLADGDRPGEEAAEAAAFRWKREGRSVRIARPPEGCDFNDLLMVDSPDSSAARR